jgi:glutathione S-transferase
MAYDMIERDIADRTWAAGEAFSIADCAAAPALFFRPSWTSSSKSHTRLERLMRRPTIK